MQKHLHTLRRQLKQVQQNRRQFSSLYLYLDTLQDNNSKTSTDSQEQDQVDKYIHPIRYMLQGYRQSIDKIKLEHGIIDATMKYKQGRLDKENSQIFTNRLQKVGREDEKQLTRRSGLQTQEGVGLQQTQKQRRPLQRPQRDPPSGKQSLSTREIDQLDQQIYQLSAKIKKCLK